MNDDLKQYIDYTTKNDLMPNNEDYKVWLYNNKDIPLTEELEKGVRGIIYIYAKRFVLAKVAKGGRNTRMYLQMLKEIKPQGDLSIAEPIIINFDNTSKTSLMKMYTKKEVKSDTK